MIKIESGIPVGEGALSKRPGYTRAMSIMQVGQSFFVAGSPKIVAGRLRRIVVQLAKTKKYAGKGLKFTVSSVEGGARIWRVE